MARALVIGLSYNGRNRLPKAEESAQIMLLHLKKMGVGRYKDNSIPNFIQASIGLKQIKEALIDLLNSQNNTGHKIFYFSGHGSEKSILLNDEQHLTASDIATILNNHLGTNKVVFVFDCCLIGQKLYEKICRYSNVDRWAGKVRCIAFNEPISDNPMIAKQLCDRLTDQKIPNMFNGERKFGVKLYETQGFGRMEEIHTMQPAAIDGNIAHHGVQQHLRPYHLELFFRNDEPIEWDFLLHHESVINIENQEEERELNEPQDVSQNSDTELAEALQKKDSDEKLRSSVKRLGL